MPINRHILLSFFCLWSIIANAQIPNGYYDSAQNLTGNELREALYNIIKDHKEYPYTATSTDVWNILCESDKDPDNPNNVILVYTGKSVNAAQEYNSRNGWSREHVWAKSHGDFGTEEGAGTDLHHLKPADISVNSARNNRDFDNGGDRYFDDGGTISTDCFSTEYTWEPRDEVKGDIARMIFYMAVRYNGANGEPNLSIKDDINTIDLCDDAAHTGYIGKLSTLLEWNTIDPVDDFERNRNNIIHTYQGNRNPFIDYPDFVGAIWHTSNNIINRYSLQFAFQLLKCSNGYSVCYIGGGLFTIVVYDIYGRIIQSHMCSNKIELDGFSKGVYLIVMRSSDSYLTYKVVI